MSVKRRPEERALDRMILELREHPAPELDWERMESRLLSEPRADMQSPAPSFWSRLRFPAAGLVAVAAVATVVMARKPAPLLEKPTAQLSTAPLNGDQLALGTRLTSGNLPLIVDHPGRARWTLEPHATAFVSNAGEFLTVKLENGALSATVVPNPKPETFAVEVEGTRVAVHGTAFRVERAGEHVQVDVSEGTVAVEPSGTHSAPAFLLRRNSRGTFALDGRTGSVEGNASAIVNDGGVPQSHRTLAKAATAVHTRTNPTAAQPTIPAEPFAQTQILPAQPSISDLEKGVSSAVDLMNRCFHDQTRTTGNRVTATTALTLSIAGDGSIQSATFAPPLAPTVEDCAVSGLRTLTFAHSTEGVTFTRVLELNR